MADIDARLDPPTDSTVTRGYRLAATGAQLLLEPAPALALGDANLATDVDVVAIHADFDGIPWTAFENQTPPPASWVTRIETLAATARATGKPIFLSVGPLDGSRDNLADAVAADGTKSAWPVSMRCFNFAATSSGTKLRAAYVAYVLWMVERFEPRWVNVAIEINQFASCGDAAWNGLVDVERAAYAAVKTRQPDAVVFPSIQLESLYGDLYQAGHDAAAYDTAYAQLARLSRDRFAISSYPYQVQVTNENRELFAKPAMMPADYLTRAADRGGETMIVAETGWLATSATGYDATQPACIEVFPQTPQNQADYLDALVELASSRSIELVTWWSDRDVLVEGVMNSCPCTYSTAWCQVVDAFDTAGGFEAEVLLKQFGTMGIRDYTGVPRQPIFDRWQAARARPVP